HAAEALTDDGQGSAPRVSVTERAAAAKSERQGCGFSGVSLLGFSPLLSSSLSSLSLMPWRRLPRPSFTLPLIRSSLPSDSQSRLSVATPPISFTLPLSLSTFPSRFFLSMRTSSALSLRRHPAVCRHRADRQTHAVRSGRARG